MARSSSCACRRWTQWQQTGGALSVKLWQITRPQKIPPKICWYSILFKCLELTSSSTQRHPQSEHCSVSIAATSRSPEASYSIVSPFSVLADPVWRLWNQIKLYNITIYVLSMFLAKEVASDGCQSLTYFHRWLVKRISLEPACPARSWSDNASNVVFKSITAHNVWWWQKTCRKMCWLSTSLISVLVREFGRSSQLAGMAVKRLHPMLSI